MEPDAKRRNRRGGATVTITWPLSAASECSVWLAVRRLQQGHFI